MNIIIFEYFINKIKSIFIVFYEFCIIVEKVINYENKILNMKLNNLLDFKIQMLIISLSLFLIFANLGYIKTLSAQTTLNNNDNSSHPFELKDRGSREAAFWDRQGAIQMDSGHPQNALLDYKIESIFASNNPTVLNNEGLALAEMGDHTGAIKYYDQSLKIDPTDSFTLANKAATLLYLGDYNGALRYFNEALYFNPNLQTAQIGKEVTLQKLNNPR